MNIPLLAFGLFIAFIAFVHGGSVNRILNSFKALITSWPLIDSIIVLVLTVLGSAWVISYL